MVCLIVKNLPTPKPPNANRTCLVKISLCAALLFLCAYWLWRFHHKSKHICHKPFLGCLQRCLFILQGLLVNLCSHTLWKNYICYFEATEATWWGCGDVLMWVVTVGKSEVNQTSSDHAWIKLPKKIPLEPNTTHGNMKVLSPPKYGL